jgi:hypothetical protein
MWRHLSVTSSGDTTYTAGNGTNLYGIVLFDDGHVLQLKGKVGFTGNAKDIGLEVK